MMSKKAILTVSTIGTFLFVFFLFAKNLGICNFIELSCTSTFDPLAENLIPVLPLFLLSLITYKMRDEVYQSWFRFARIWIPLSMILILVTPEYSTDRIYSIDKGTVAFFSSLIFLIISLVVIVYKHISSSSNKSQSI